MSVSLRLQIVYVDNDVGERSATISRISLKNERLLHLEQEPEPKLLTTCLWTLDDPSVIGIPDLDETEATKVFALALSVQSSRFLHSPVIIDTVSALGIDKKGMFGILSTKLVSPEVELDEDKFVEAAAALRKMWSRGGRSREVLLAAINSYWDGHLSVHVRSRYLNLWAALERLANAYSKKSVNGGDLDRRIGWLAGRVPHRIEPLRRLNNHLKHADSVRQLPASTIANIGRDSRLLKQLVDRSLARRCHFKMSRTYRP